MARIVSRALPLASRSPLRLPPPPPLPGAALLRSAAAAPALPPAAPAASLLSWRGLTATHEPSLAATPPFAGFLAGIRGLRKLRRGQTAAKRPQPQDSAPPPPPPPPPPPKESEIELIARIGVEEDMPDDAEVLVRIALYEPSLFLYYSWSPGSEVPLQTPIKLLRLLYSA